MRFRIMNTILRVKLYPVSRVYTIKRLISLSVSFLFSSLVLASELSQSNSPSSISTMLTMYILNKSIDNRSTFLYLKKLDKDPDIVTSERVNNIAY